MSPQRLITQCPHCDTRFRITAAQLDAAGGKARCSRCRQVFNARQALQSDEPRRPARGTAKPAAEPQPSTPREAPPPAAAVEFPLEIAPHSRSGAAQLDLNLAAEAEPATALAQEIDPFAAAPDIDECSDTAADRPSEAPPDADADDEDLGFDLDSPFNTALDATDDEVTPAGSTPSDTAFPDDAIVPAGYPADDALTAHAAYDAEPHASNGAWDEIVEPQAAAHVAAPPAGDADDADDTVTAVDQDLPTTNDEPPIDGDPLLASIAEIEALEVDVPEGDAPPTSPWAEAQPPENDAASAAAGEAATAPGAAWHFDSYEHAVESARRETATVSGLFSEWGQPPTPAADTAPAAPDVAEEAGHDEEFEPPATAEEPLFDEPEPAAPLPATAPDDSAPEAAASDDRTPEAAPLPDFGDALAWELEQTLGERQRRLPAVLFGIGSLALTALLLYQAGTHWRSDLARYPALAPLGEWLCQVQPCAAVTRRAPERIRIVNRDVRPHPSEPGALLISLGFVSEADFPQPYPTLEVSFSDLQDRLVALRRFQPAEYLSGERRSADLLPPGDLVPVSLSVVDPGEAGVSFRFEFY